jgi:hypothetical protein
MFTKVIQFAEKNNISSSLLILCDCLSVRVGNVGLQFKGVGGVIVGCYSHFLAKNGEGFIILFSKK